MKTALFYENIMEGANRTGTAAADVLAELRDAGMEALYISADSWERDRKELSPVLSRLGIPVCGMHGFCNFAENPNTKRYREMIDLALEAGAEDLLFVPGMYSTGNTARDLDNMVCGMRKAAEYGRSRNLSVLMEDFDGVSAPYNCIAGLRYFFQQVPELGCAFDTGNFVTYRENELQAYDLFADRIRTVHLKDRSTGRRHPGDQPFLCADGQAVYTCASGRGYIQTEEILKKLRERNYAGSVVIELYSCDPCFILQSARESLQWVKREIMKENAW